MRVIILPDEWIPCVDEAQRLALGDARIDIKWLGGKDDVGQWASKAYRYADAMLAAREAK